MKRICKSCGLEGNWQSTVCGPCRKAARQAELRRATPRVNDRRERMTITELGLRALEEYKRAMSAL